MLTELYHEKLQLIHSLYPKVIHAMKLWENAVNRSLVGMTPDYTRSKAILQSINLNQLCIRNAESFECDLDYIMESALKALGKI